MYHTVEYLCTGSGSDDFLCLTPSRKPKLDRAEEEKKESKNHLQESIYLTFAERMTIIVPVRSLSPSLSLVFHILFSTEIDEASWNSQVPTECLGAIVNMSRSKRTPGVTILNEKSMSEMG